MQKVWIFQIKIEIIYYFNDNIIIISMKNHFFTINILLKKAIISIVSILIHTCQFSFYKNSLIFILYFPFIKIILFSIWQNSGGIFYPYVNSDTNWQNSGGIFYPYVNLHTNWQNTVEFFIPMSTHTQIDKIVVEFFIPMSTHTQIDKIVVEFFIPMSTHTQIDKIVVEFFYP